MSARIAVIPGDGVGPEIVPDGVRVLSTVDPGLEFVELDWGCARWKRTGAMMPTDGLAQLRGYDAVYLGSIGWPTVPDHVSLWGGLMPLRKAFELYGADRVERAIETVCREGRHLTADLGGRATTREVGDAVLAALA